MPRLLALVKMLRDERERGLGHFTPSVVNGQGMPAIGYFMDLRHAGILLLLLEGGMGNRPRHGVVMLAGDDQQRPTLGIFVSTWASVHGLRLAVAAWKSGTPEPGTEYFSYSSCASLSSTALAKAKRNCS